MLYTNDTNNLARLLGIDPGSETLGTCTMTFDIGTLQLMQVSAQTYVGSKLGLDSWMSVVHSTRFARIHAHYENLRLVLGEVHPIAVCCESPFYNSRFPQAYGALIEVVNGIRQALWDYDRHIQLDMVDPPRVKKAVSAMGNAKKDDVLRAVMSIPEIVNAYVGSVPLHLLDEHSIDAIAVAYFKLKEYRGI